MGTLTTQYCLISGIPVEQNLPTTQEGYDYKLDVNGKKIIISLSPNFKADFDILMSKDGYKLRGLIFNGIWTSNIDHLTLESANKLLGENYFPILPKEKLDALLEFVYSKQSYDGEIMRILNIHLFGERGGWNNLYFKNEEECRFYLSQLREYNFANVNYQSHDTPVTIQITLKGIEYISNILEGKSSNICFVAMAFDVDLGNIYTDAIKIAIEETGFKPLIIKDEHLPSDVTINDGILAGIKKAKFMIADFTRNKRGVYFEAGYALGRGQKVIYTCKDDFDDLNELHFDTNHYQHILWKDVEDLKKKLIDKIEVFIKP